MSAPRFQSVEAWRTLAALCIAFYHFLLFNDGSSALFPEFTATNTVFELLRTAVLVFFIVTAIVIPVHCEQADYTLSDYPRFLLKRLVRVHIPFLVVITLTVLLQQAFFIFDGKGMQIDGFRAFANVTLTAEFFHVEWYNTIFWTLAIEMQFYIVIGLLFPFIRRYGLTAIAIIFFVEEITCYFLPDSRFFWFYTPFFSIGLVLWLWYKKSISTTVVLIATALTSLCVYTLHEKITVWFAIIAPLAILLMNSRATFVSRLGKYTYIFYLIHGISGGSVLYFTRSWGSDTSFSVLRVLLAFSVAFAASWLFYRVLEKPTIRLTHRIRYKV